MLDSLKNYAAATLGTYDPDLTKEPLEAFEHGDYNTPELEEYNLETTDLEPYLDRIEEREALQVTGDDVHGVFDGDQPTLLNEAAAIAASLEQYSDQIPDHEQLGVELYDHIVNETGLAEQLLEESEDDGTVHPSTVTSIYRNNVVPDLDGGDGDTYIFTYEEGSGWTIADGGEQGVELLRKRRSAIGKKSPREHPDNMWRLRHVALEDGKTTTTWKEDPTRTTAAVHEAAQDVMQEVRATYPSAELTLFGSVEQGTMHQGSDLEHAVHIHVDDVDEMVEHEIETAQDVSDHYMDVYSTVNQFRREVEQAIIEAADERGHDVRRGYGYVAVRDDEIEYPLNREERFQQDERVLVTDEVGHIEFNTYQQEQGLRETHPGGVHIA
ncbi:MAG: hypothetical protein SVU32_04610 [Candidatus Nanohaloarchaea archaeon]|nr:hypothetical protein [Candidatus Nanohaloarchaea archaeon]